MHALLAFLTLLFSMWQSTSIHQAPTLQPDSQTAMLSEPAPSRAEIAHYQEASVYAGSGCITCQKTSLIYTTR
jgi:hypothetical protein